MPSLRRGRAARVVSPRAGTLVAFPPAAPTGAADSADAGASPPLPAAVVAHAERALQAVTDAVRFPLTRLVRSVAARLVT